MRDIKYPGIFLELVDAYPKFPIGRTKRFVAFKAWKTVGKSDGLSEQDWHDIIQNVKERVAHDKRWVKTDTYGPPGLQTYINQRRWADEYEKRTERTLDRYDRANLEDEFRNQKTSKDRKDQIQRIKESGFRLVDATR